MQFNDVESIWITVVEFGLVWFYGMSLTIDYLMWNPFFIYTKYMIFNHFADNAFKEALSHFIVHS